MAGFSTEAKVGVFVMVALALLAFMTLRLGKIQFEEPKGYEVWGLFDSAIGLKKNAPVEMAGIQIGSVNKIELDRGRARISLRIHPDVQLPSDSIVLIRTRGVLGDKYVAVEAGSPEVPALKPGAEMPKARVTTDIDQVMAKIGYIADDLKDITASLRISLASPESQVNIKESLTNIRELTATLKVVAADNQERLNRVVMNLDQFTGDLSQLSRDNKQALDQTIKNFQVVSAQLNRTITGLTSVVEKIDRGEGSIGALVNERKTVDDLNSTLASLKEISKKIDDGKGTIGRLVNDDTTATKIDEALTGVNDYITRADAWKVYVDYRGEYLFSEAALRSTLNLRLQPKDDKFYILGIVDDQVGKRSDRETLTTTYAGGTSSQVRVKTTSWDKDNLKFNAQIGKRYHDLTLRAGLLAYKGGFAFDYHLFKDQMTLTLEANDFRVDTRPHLKAAVDYKFWKYFYVTAGVDDFISEDDRANFFAGAGLNFFDDDLKFLLTNAPK
ncbi:phospholipid/cholesterol/gamma-HCH transport system substrate-binding protein [Desulfarculales bacterium]